MILQEEASNDSLRQEKAVDYLWQVAHLPIQNTILIAWHTSPFQEHIKTYN